MDEREVVLIRLLHDRHDRRLPLPRAESPEADLVVHFPSAEQKNDLLMTSGPKQRPHVLMDF
jgi:hypothetical protein